MWNQWPVRTPQDFDLMLINHRHHIVLYVWVKCFWTTYIYISSTLGHCSLFCSDDWLTSRWEDQQKSKHCHTCLSVCVCWLPAVDFRLGSDTLLLPFSPSASAAPFLLAAMRTAAVAAVMVMLCTMVVHADVKPQRDFSVRRVKWTHTHTRLLVSKSRVWYCVIGTERGAVSFCSYSCLLCASICERTLCSDVCLCLRSYRFHSF